MLTGGILEDMFSGYGAEYLYFRPNKNYSFGIEVFNVRKRDYEWGFGHLDYENTTFTANFFLRNYGLIPFDMKLSAGEYLAGDVGSTIEFSRTLQAALNLEHLQLLQMSLLKSLVRVVLIKVYFLIFQYMEI